MKRKWKDRWGQKMVLDSGYPDEHCTLATVADSGNGISIWCTDRELERTALAAGCTYVDEPDLLPCPACGGECVCAHGEWGSVNCRTCSYALYAPSVEAALKLHNSIRRPA